MKKSWTCSKCLLVFSRKWNLDRHVRLMHNEVPNSANIPGALKIDNDGRPASNDSQSIIQDTLKQLSEFEKLLNMTSKYRQNSDNQIFFESSVNSLRQKLASYEKMINDLYSYNLLFPKGAAQGISGYVCNNCQTFSYKAIFDLGCDMTMESKHRCHLPEDKRSYMTIPFPPGVSDFDDWAAQYLLEQVNFYVPIGKYLVAKEITGLIGDFRKDWNTEVAHRIVGVPDRYPFYSFENYIRSGWIGRAIDNLNRKITMADVELLDFFRRVKSTYSIIEIPIDGTPREFFMYITN